MIIAINYADDKFKKSQKLNTKTAYLRGKVDRVIEYSPKDIDQEFKNKNKNIFSYKRGAGLWLWKPYIIFKTLKIMEEGDYLFYCDSGSYYINRVQYLVDCMEENNESIMAFELPLISEQWTKNETFEFLGCNCDEFKKSNQILATYILIKKNNKTIKLIEEFLEACCDEKIISYKNFNKSIINSESYISHREDQSVFSILCRKHKITAFRDPSQYGNRPWEYRHNRDYIYNPKNYVNSNYPQILASYRNQSVFKFTIKEILKKVLSLVNLYSEKSYNKKRNL